MTERKYVLPVSEALSISGSDADKLIKSGRGDAALLYIYILRNGGSISIREAASALGRTEQELRGGMSCLASLGLVRYEDKEAPPEEKRPLRDEPCEYTAADVAREMENGADFKSLVQETQRLLGKVMSTDDLIRFYGIYDSFGLPPEVIMQLVSHCISECRGKSGTHRNPTMRYIEKAAATWEQEGIFTIEEAENYIKRLSRLRSKRGEIKAALGIRDRDLTVSESRYIDGWIRDGFEAPAVEIAYDRTVLKTGKLSWGYIDSIMKNWHSKGLHTPDEIAKGDARPQRSQQPTEGGQPYPGRNVKASADMEHMKRLLKKLGGD